MTFGRCFTIVVLASALSSCGGNDEPSASDIAVAYSNSAKQEYDQAVRDAGGEENVSPFVVGLLKFRYAVDKTECEKAEGDLGYLCIYDLNVTAANGENLPLIKDVRGRIYKGSDGWLVEEL